MGKIRGKQAKIRIDSGVVAPGIDYGITEIEFSGASVWSGEEEAMSAEVPLYKPLVLTAVCIDGQRYELETPIPISLVE